MNKEIFELSIKAISELRNNFELPKTGLIAGGSLCKLIYGYKYGVIFDDYDIDIFNIIYKEDTKDLKMVEVNKKGLVSYIDIETNNINPLYIVSTFDFNCVKIGFDLSTNLLHIHDEFVDFIDSNKLNVSSNVFNINRSIIRYYKKLDEFGLKEDDENIKRLNSQLHFNYNYINDNDFNTYSKYKENIDKYFIINKKDNGYFFLKNKKQI